MDIDELKRLNEIYRGRSCILCGRSFPDTLLDVEAIMHHHMPPRCKDQNDCKKAARRKKT